MRIHIESGEVIHAHRVESDDVKYNGFHIQVRAYEDRVYNCIVHVRPSHPIIQSVLENKRVLIATNMPILTTPASNEYYDAMLLFVKNPDKTDKFSAELIRPHNDTQIGLQYNIDGEGSDLTYQRLSRVDSLCEIRSLHIDQNKLYYKNSLLLDSNGYPALTSHISGIFIC